MKFTEIMNVAVLPTRKENGKVVQERCSTCDTAASPMLELNVLDEWEEEAHTFICAYCLHRMADVLYSSG